MTAKSRLQRALRLLDDAESTLQDVQADSSGGMISLIDDALSDIEDAAREIKSVIREVR